MILAINKVFGEGRNANTRQHRVASEFAMGESRVYVASSLEKVVAPPNEQKTE